MSKPQILIARGQTPLTDPRSFGSSALLHALLLLILSLTVVNAALPIGESGHPRALYGELDPTDNRASVPPSPGEGGGGAGEIGGTSSVPFVAPADGTKPHGATRDPVAETLLSEILPSFEPKPSESVQRVARPSDSRPRTHSRLRFWRRGRGRRRFRRRRRPRDRARDPVLRRAITLIPLPTSSTAPAAWRAITRLTSQNVKCFPALTSFHQTLSSP